MPQIQNAIQAADTLPMLTACEPIVAVDGAAYFSTSRMPWTTSVKWKGLSTRKFVNDPANGFRVEMQRLDPGAYLHSHGHPDEFEQVYVINGDFIDSHHTMQGGDFVYRRPSVPHTAASKYGGDVLVIFNKFANIAGHNEQTQPELQTHALTNPKAGTPEQSQAPLWKKSEKWPGLSERVVFNDAEFGLHGVIQRLEPGTFLHSHGHADEFEQVFVISGDFCDDAYLMSPGDYVYRSPKKAHTASSTLGAEVLVIFHKNKG